MNEEEKVETEVKVDEQKCLTGLQYLQLNESQVRITVPAVEAWTQTDQWSPNDWSLFTDITAHQNSQPDSHLQPLWPPVSPMLSTINAEQIVLSHAEEMSNKKNFILLSDSPEKSVRLQQCNDVQVKSAPYKRNRLSGFIIALRPWSFPASITPVALGSCLAYKSQGFCSISIFFMTIFTALCVHAAGNLVNTYFDFMRGVDNKKSDDRTLVDSILLPNDVVTLGVCLYIAGCFGFAIVNFLSPAKMEHLALIYFCGLSSSFLYTGGLGLKYIAMGDILIVLTFGPLTVVFSYLSQTGQLSLVPLMYAIPLALNTEAILHCNNTRDMDGDKQAGAITVAILLGKTGSYALFCFLLFTPYLLFIIVGIHFSSWILLPAVSIFLAFRIEKEFRRGSLTALPQSVAQLNLIMGILYITSLLLSNWNSLPSMAQMA